MNLDQFSKKQILEDTFKLQYLFGLKNVIRYNQSRDVSDLSESVAEHLYGMMLLVQFFLPLEDPSGKWNKARIHELITLHDIDEIETGDILGWAKTAEHREAEAFAFNEVLRKSPHSMLPHLQLCYREYKDQITAEAQFVKAIDKIEPFFQIYNERGRILLHDCKTTADCSLRIKTPYIEQFPYIKKFAAVIHEMLIEGGYYWEEEV